MTRTPPVRRPKKIFHPPRLADSGASQKEASLDPERSADHSDTPVLCLGGRGPLDEAASAMIAQLLEKHGFRAVVAPYAATSRETIGRLETKGVRMVCISFLEISGSPPHLRYTIRRLRQKLPGSSILVGLWPESDAALTDRGIRAQIGTQDLCKRRSICVSTQIFKDEDLSASSSPRGTSVQVSRGKNQRDYQFRTFSRRTNKGPGMARSAAAASSCSLRRQ
jgi:hypothetical protein